jgi:hypothetical protein
MSGIITVPKSETINIHTPKLTKLTKRAKIQFIKDAIKSGAFDRDEACTVLGVKDRQVRRYLNEIAKQDSESNPDGTHILRSLCLASLTKKAALGKLSSTSEVAIVLAGETKKLDVNETIKEIKLEWKLESNPSNTVYTSPETT